MLHMNFLLLSEQLLRELTPFFVCPVLTRNKQNEDLRTLFYLVNKTILLLFK